MWLELPEMANTYTSELFLSYFLVTICNMIYGAYVLES